VGKKVFAFLGMDAMEGDFVVGVKLPGSGGYAVEEGFGEPMGYNLGRSGWVTVSMKGGEPPLDVLCEWVEESYRAVAPKKLVKELDARG